MQGRKLLDTHPTLGPMGKLMLLRAVAPYINTAKHCLARAKVMKNPDAAVHRESTAQVSKAESKCGKRPYAVCQMCEPGGTATYSSYSSQFFILF